MTRSKSSPTALSLGTYILGSQNYIYNPTTNIWTATGNKLRNDRSDEGNVRQASR